MERKLLAATSLLVFLFGALAWLAPEFAAQSLMRQRPIPLAVTLMCLAGGAYIFILHQLKGQIWQSPSSWLLPTILIVGVAMRAMMSPTEPILENDFNRYLLDGATVAEGINPYQFPPQLFLEQGCHSHKCQTLQNKIHGNREALEVLKEVNHKSIRSIYPPVAQGFFLIAYWIEPWSVDAWMKVLAIADVLTLLGLLLCLRQLRLPLLMITIYWINPVLVKETYNSLHLEALLLAPVSWALYFGLLQKKWSPMASVVMLVLATGVKIWPAALLPILLMGSTKDWRQRLTGLLTFCVLTALIFTPFLLVPRHQGHGLVAFSQAWKMNDALFQAMVFILRSEIIARALGVIAVIAWFLVLARHTREPQHIPRQVSLGVCGFLLLTPTQFPWYLIWTLPGLTLFPLGSFLTYAALIPIYYLRFYLRALGLTEWFDHGIVFLEHGVVYLLIYREVARRLWQPLPPAGHHV